MRIDFACVMNALTQYKYSVLNRRHFSVCIDCKPFGRVSHIWWPSGKLWRRTMRDCGEMMETDFSHSSSSSSVPFGVACVVNWVAVCTQIKCNDPKPNVRCARTPTNIFCSAKVMSSPVTSNHAISFFAGTRIRMHRIAKEYRDNITVCATHWRYGKNLERCACTNAHLSHQIKVRITRSQFSYHVWCLAVRFGCRLLIYTRLPLRTMMFDHVDMSCCVNVKVNSFRCPSTRRRSQRHWVHQ